jgi:hypothetical protein
VFLLRSNHFQCLPADTARRAKDSYMLHAGKGTL